MANWIKANFHSKLEIHVIIGYLSQVTVSVTFWQILMRIQIPVKGIMIEIDTRGKIKDFFIDQRFIFF